MASRKSAANRPGSPVKKQASMINASQQQHEDYLERDFARGLTEVQVENEHLKTTIVALSEQVTV
jgi:hypothetical protein